MWWLAFKFLKSKALHYVFLNILRVCNIIALATVMVASWALAIKINMDKPFFVFDAASLVFMSMIATFLLISELPWGNKFFDKNWPAFGPDKGLGWLSLALIMIGCNTLGNLNNKNVNAEKIGSEWWSLNIAAGSVTLALGVLNLIFGLILGAGEHNARQVRTYGSSSPPDKLPYDNASSYHEKEDKSSFLRLPKKVLKLTGLRRHKGGNDHACKDTYPPSRSASPQAYDLERNPSMQHRGDDDRLNHRNEALDRLSGGDQDGGGPSSSSSKPITSPIAPNVMRPDSQQHPFYKYGGGGRPTSSVYDGPKHQHYSTASKLTQFPTGPYDRFK